MTTHFFSSGPAGKWFRGAPLGAGLFLVASEPVRGAWHLDGSDEFNGNSINPANWTFAIGNGVGGWGNNELEYYTSNPQNAYVTNGLLHIVARAGAYDGFNYTSAKLES